MIRFCLSLYLFIVAIYLLSASGRIGLSDSVAMFNVAQSVVTERSLSSEPCDPQLLSQPNHCVPGVDGRHYAGFGLVPSLLAVPAVLCGRWIAAGLHVNALIVSRVSVSVFTALFSPLVCVVLAMWIVKLGYSRRAAMLGAFILAFASPFWHFSVKGFYSEPYVTLALLLAAYLLSFPRLPLAAGLSGLAFGVACGCRVNVIILFPVFLLFLALQIRARGLSVAHLLREAGLFTASFSVCALLIGWANYARFGSPLKTGYHLAYPSASALLSTPFFHGTFELLFNAEVGLLIFAPWVLVVLICFPSIVRAHLPESVLCGALFLMNFLFFAKYDSWHGGRVAGPRFLTPTLPFLVVALVLWIERRKHRDATERELRPWAVLRMVMMILLTTATLIQFLGVIFPENRYYALMGIYGDSRLIEFYADTPQVMAQYRGPRVRPWWAGSIPLASVDFVPRVDAANAQPDRPGEVRDHDLAGVVRQQAQVRAAQGTTNTEEDFLRSFPNSENLTLPNLMLFKMKLLGLPASVKYGYSISAGCLGLIGLMGLNRYVQSTA